MSYTTKNATRNIVLCLGVLLLIGCSNNMIIRKQEVTAVPKAGYERIIKLNNPEGAPDRTLAGVVHVTGRATVCTDYPREEMIKSLDDLTEMEKKDFPYFLNYSIEDGGAILGYVSIPVGYRANIWRNEKDSVCQYKVQIIWPERARGNADHDGADKSMSSW